jgi:predicted lipoprotein
MTSRRRDRPTVRRLILLLAAVVACVLLWSTGFTVVRSDDASTKPEVFDPVAYVDGSWERIATTVRDDSVDLAEILTAMAPDPDGRVQKTALKAVTEKYGVITQGEAHVYKVKLTGTVTAVNVESSVGTIEITLDGYAGPVTVQVYVGSRIPSDESSVRDSVGFIGFGDFHDQTEYGKVAAEINGRILTMLSDIDLKTLEGKTVTVYGAMTIRTFNLVQIDVSTIKIVPVAIELS